MHKKLEINRTKIKGGCQPGSKVVTYNSKSDLPLELNFLKLEKSVTSLKYGVIKSNELELEFFYTARTVRFLIE